MKKIILPIACILSVAMITSCGNGQSSSTKTNNDSTKVAQKADTGTVEAPQTGTLQYMLPSPLQVVYVFKKSGLKYHSNLTTSTDEVSNFNSKLSQRLAFGIYSTDLGYSVLNGKNQDAVNYIKTLGSLSEKIWMTNVFDNSALLKRFKNNIGNQDSLLTIIADIQKSMDSYTQQNGLSSSSAEVFCGAWIETMYIATQSYKVDKAIGTFDRLNYQSSVLDNLLAILNKQKDSGTASIIGKLSNIQTILKSISNNASGKINDSQIQQLTSAVADAKKLITA